MFGVGRPGFYVQRPRLPLLWWLIMLLAMLQKTLPARRYGHPRLLQLLGGTAEIAAVGQPGLLTNQNGPAGRQRRRKIGSELEHPYTIHLPSSASATSNASRGLAFIVSKQATEPTFSLDHFVVNFRFQRRRIGLRIRRLTAWRSIAQRLMWPEIIMIGRVRLADIIQLSQAKTKHMIQYFGF